MAALILWKNQEIKRLKKDMDRLISRFWDDFEKLVSARPVTREPFLHMIETEDNLVVHVDVPGIDPADLDVSVTDDILTIKGSTHGNMTGEEGNSGRQTRHGFFARAVQLPCKVLIHEVSATYTDEALEILLPKCRKELPREVRIQIR